MPLITSGNGLTVDANRLVCAQNPNASRHGLLPRCRITPGLLQLAKPAEFSPSNHWPSSQLLFQCAALRGAGAQLLDLLLQATTAFTQTCLFHQQLEQLIALIQLLLLGIESQPRLPFGFNSAR